MEPIQERISGSLPSIYVGQMLQALQVCAYKVTKVIWAPTDTVRGLTQSHSVKGSKMRNGEKVGSCGPEGSARGWSHTSHEKPFPETP